MKKLMLLFCVLFISFNGFGQRMAVEVTPQPNGEAPIVKTIFVTDETTNYVVYVYPEEADHKKQMVMRNKSSEIVYFVSVNKYGMIQTTAVGVGQRIFVHENLNFSLIGGESEKEKKVKAIALETVFEMTEL